MWLHFGEVKQFGDTKEVIAEYQKFIKDFGKMSDEDKKKYRRENLEKQKIHSDESNEIVNLEVASRGKNITQFLQFGFLFILLIISAINLLIK